MMRIIDAHVHLVERMAGFGINGELRAIGDGKARWSNGEVKKYIPDGYGDIDFTGESLLRFMDNNNIDKAVLLQGSMYGFQNEYTWEMCNKYPDKFAGACTLDPFAKNSDQILERFLNKLNFKIMKFELSNGGGLMGYHNYFELDGVEMKNIWSKVAEHNLTVALDLGDRTMESYQLGAVRRIALKYPNIKIVICHLLAPLPGEKELLKKNLDFLNLPNIWFDVAALPVFNSSDKYPFPSAQDNLRIAKRIVGANKLIWGTDCPHAAVEYPYQELKSYISDFDIFSEEEKQMFFYDNALNVYFNS